MIIFKFGMLQLIELKFFEADDTNHPTDVHFKMAPMTDIDSVCINTHTFIYIYIYRERERERERD